MKATDHKGTGQKGSIIIPVLMILALLSVVGLTAANTTTTELQIVRNKVVYKQNLYLAEAAVMAEAQRLELTSTADLKAGGVYGVYEDVDMREPANWADNSVTAFDSNDDGVTEQGYRLGQSHRLQLFDPEPGVERFMEAMGGEGE